MSVQTETAYRSDAAIVPLGDSGTELVVVPETALARLAARPIVAQAITTSRSALGAVAPHARTAAKFVAAVTVTAPAPRVGRRVGRFVAGHPMIGPPRTNSTFWRAGSKPATDIRGAASPWDFLPGWQRSAARVGAVVVLWAVATALSPTATCVVTTGVAVLAVVWGVWGVLRLRRGHRHARRFLWPLHNALAGSVHTTARHPKDWLHVPADFESNPGVEIRIDLPSHFDGSDGSQNHVKTVVCNKLGLASDSVVRWRLKGDRPHMILTEPQRPPQSVKLADIIDAIRRAPDTRPVVGLAAARAIVAFDLEAESPHVLVSAGSGAGKSALLRAILAQGLAKGGYGIVLDIKQVSHMWASNLPNCEYYRTAEAIHDRLISLKDEVDRRNDLVVRYADTDGNTDHIDVGPRIYVLAEEMNATIGRLNSYWRSNKEKGEPNLSPAVEALQDLLFMGRQIKIHVLAVAQMASARSMGGPEARENFAMRCLARYTQNAWKMLVPEVWPMPKKSKHPGRWQVVIGGSSTETQIAYFTPREAREMALAGLPEDDSMRPSVTGSQLSCESGDLGQAPETVSGGLPPAISLRKSADGDPPVDAQILVDLREAIETGVVEGWTLAGLRKAKARYTSFPKPVQRDGSTHRYDAEELGKWSRNHRSKIDGEGGDDEEDD